MLTWIDILKHFVVVFFLSLTVFVLLFLFDCSFVIHSRWYPGSTTISVGSLSYALWYSVLSALAFTLHFYTFKFPYFDVICPVCEKIMTINRADFPCMCQICGVGFVPLRGFYKVK